MPKVDLTGTRFGRLVVLREDEPYYSPNNQKFTKWLCQCDCGNQVSVIGNSLKRGLTTSCGCLHKENSRKDITGQRFGKLTAIKSIEQDNKPLLWECICDCGNIITVRGDRLRSGKVTHCLKCGDFVNRVNNLKEHYRPDIGEIVGKRFSNLIVIEKLDEKTKNGKRLYLCKYDNGKLSKKPKSAILRKETNNENNFTKITDNILKNIYYNEYIYADKSKEGEINRYLLKDMPDKYIDLRTMKTLLKNGYVECIGSDRYILSLSGRKIIGK